MDSTTEQRKVTMKIAHVLFMDIVAYSQLPTDRQTKVLQTLKEIVEGTAEVIRAQADDQLISLATGDGIALVFFHDPMAPVQCALEISKALVNHPEIKLRMGIHSGPVDEIVDVNERINVAGAGINMAQRVMDSGDAGHILLSRRVAEDLAQYSSWQPFLHDLEEVEVKHGVRVHLFNLYTGDAGNASLPEKVRRSKKRNLRTAAIIACAVVLLTLIVAAATMWWRARPKPLRPEAEFKTLLLKKTDTWIPDIFATQAPDGGMKGVISGMTPTTQVWTTAQALVAVLSTDPARQPKLDNYVPKIKAAFEYINKLRRTTPSEGWNYYGNTIPYTVTEINGWVTLAYIKSLDSKTPIWNDRERTEIVSRVVHDLEELARRQDPTGGFRPIREGGPEFTRTYATVIAMWALVTARTTPSVRDRIGTQYDERIRSGITWLLQTYKEGQGWVQNPNRTGQKDRFDGLTAQTLFVLSLVETLPDCAYLKNDRTYQTAKEDFLNNKDLSRRSIDKNNSHISDADVGFPPTEFMAEGSTFLWFPWTLLELTQLASDKGLSAEERKAASQLRLEILNANANSLGNYVESSNLTYIFAENLFCMSAYVNAPPQ